MKTFKQFMLEASLSRVFSHISNPKRAIGIITAFRAENTQQENLSKNKILAATVQKAGYGYFWVDGWFIENQGTAEEIKVKEDSIFIVGNENDNGKLKGLLRTLIKTYNQDAALYKADGNPNAILIDKSGAETSIGAFSANRIRSFMTALRKKPNSSFVFESVRAGDTFFGRLLNSKK